MNPNYATIIKQNTDKLLAIGFIVLIEETTWLSSIVVVPKKNRKLKICVDFRKFSITTKDPRLLPFTYDVINTFVGHEVYLSQLIFKISSYIDCTRGLS